MDGKREAGGRSFCITCFLVMDVVLPVRNGFGFHFFFFLRIYTARHAEFGYGPRAFLGPITLKREKGRDVQKTLIGVIVQHGDGRVQFLCVHPCWFCLCNLCDAATLLRAISSRSERDLSAGGRPPSSVYGGPRTIPSFTRVYLLSTPIYCSFLLRLRSGTILTSLAA